MPTYIKGEKVANATSYELHEKVGGSYNKLAEKNEINFEVSALGLAAGNHTFVVKAKAEGYADSEYSNELTYTIEAKEIPIDFTTSVGYYTSGVSGVEYGVWTPGDTRFATTSVYEVKAGQTIIVHTAVNYKICAIMEVDADGNPIGSAALVAGPYSETGTYAEDDYTYTATKDMYCRSCCRTDRLADGSSFTVTIRG